MNQLQLDEDKCISCRTCFEACWVDALRWDDDKGVPVMAYPEDCVGCNFCEISCTESAIEIVIDYATPFPCSYIAGQA